MLALAEEAEPGFLECFDRLEMIDAGKLRHAQTVTSISRTSASRSESETASRYSRIASWMFSRASCSVFPCDQHPGNPGQETLKPSSDSCKTTLYFIATPLAGLYFMP